MEEPLSVSSRYIVMHFREVLEAVLRGRVVIITHYNRPRAALLPFDLWERLHGAAPDAQPERSTDPAHS